MSIKDLEQEIKVLNEATRVSLVELEKNIQLTQQTVLQFDSRLKYLENAIKFMQNFQKNDKLSHKCDN
jgi:hypothetical protein